MSIKRKIKFVGKDSVFYSLGSGEQSAFYEGIHSVTMGEMSIEQALEWVGNGDIRLDHACSRPQLGTWLEEEDLRDLEPDFRAVNALIEASLSFTQVGSIPDDDSTDSSGPFARSFVTFGLPDGFDLNQIEVNKALVYCIHDKWSGLAFLTVERKTYFDDILKTLTISEDTQGKWPLARMREETTAIKMTGILLLFLS